jgi:hypothetical protein
VAANFAAGAGSIGTLQSLSINSPSTISVGTLPASVIGTYSVVPSVNLTAVAAYTSGDTNILTVNSSGYITALTAGTTTLTASYGGLSTTNTITVAALPLHRYSFWNSTANDSGAAAPLNPANGTLEGNAQFANGALAFDGVNSWVSLPSLLVNGFTAGTFEFWLTWNGGADWQRIFDFGANGAPPGQQGVWQYTDLTLTLPDGWAPTQMGLFEVDNSWSQWGPGNDDTELEISLLSTNALHQVVWTYDGTTSTLYVDGVAGATESPMNFPYHFDGATNCWLGQDLLENQSYYNGSMTEFRLYDVALTPQQVAADAASGPQTFAAPGAFQPSSLNLTVATSLGVGIQANATVTGSFANVSNVNLTLFSTYSSSATNVLTVNAQGAVIGVSLGQATLTATYDGISATQQITVVPSPAQLTHRYEFWTNTANDSVGTANGTLHGDATVSGGALNLDGNGFLTLPPGTIDSTYAALTIEMWANLGSANNVGNVISSFGNPSADWIRLATHSGATPGDAFIGFFNGSETQGWLPGPVSGNVHLVAEWNPFFLGTMEFYVNGYPANGNNISTFLDAISGANNLTNVIGANFDGNYGTIGTIQEYRIYSGALTLPQIRTSLAAGPANAPLIANQINAGTITNVTVSTYPNFIAGAIQDPVVLASSATVQNINLTTLPDVTFTSGNTNVLAVLANNQVQAVGVGTATLTATYLGVSGQTTVTTIAAPPLMLTHRYSFVSDASDSIAGENGALMGNATASGGLNLAAVTNGGGSGDYLLLPRDLVGGYPALTIESWVTLSQEFVVSRVWSFGSSTYGGGGDASGMLFTPDYGGYCALIAWPVVGVGSIDEMNIPTDVPGSSISLYSGQLVQVVSVLDPVNEHIGAVYYNGQLAGVQEFLDPVTQVNVQQCLVGKSAHVTDPFLLGTINEFRVYYGAMTAGQAAANYAAGISTVAVNTGAAQISDPPVAQTVLAGQPATFAVGAIGAPPLSYQWVFGGNPIQGATAAIYTIPSAGAGNAGLYSVQVSNLLSAGSPALSTPVQLSVVSSLGLTNGLLLHLPFDGNYNDVSGNGNNGQPEGSPVFIPGKIGSGAIHVNTAVAGGVYNYVSVPNSAAFDYSGDFSVSFWQRHTGLPNDMPMVGTALGSTYSLGWVFTDDLGMQELTLGDNNSVVKGFDPNTAYGLPAPNSPVVNDGNWHHVAMTLNRELGFLTLYVDGSQIGIATVASLGDELLGNVTSGNAITIGQDPSGSYKGTGQATFEYDIDDLAVWSRPLSLSEVQAVYTIGQAGQSVTGTVQETMTVQQTASGCQLNWTTGVLQSAPTVTGPWTAVPGATAPSYQYTPSGTTNQFFRVQLSGGGTLQ